MKTYTIEIQKVKAMSNAHGLVNARIDAIVAAQPSRRYADEGADEGAAPHSVLSFSEDTARVLMLLLKAQLAEFDKRKAKSRF